MSVQNNFKKIISNNEFKCDVKDCKRNANYTNMTYLVKFCSQHMKAWEEKLRTSEIKNMKSLASHNFHRNKPTE